MKRVRARQDPGLLAYTDLGRTQRTESRVGGLVERKPVPDLGSDFIELQPALPSLGAFAFHAFSAGSSAGCVLGQILLNYGVIKTYFHWKIRFHRGFALVCHQWLALSGGFSVNGTIIGTGHTSPSTLETLPWTKESTASSRTFL